MVGDRKFTDNSIKGRNPMSKRLAMLMALSLVTFPLAACNDNAVDNAEEAQEEAASGDMEEANEEAAEMNRNLEQGDTTEALN